MKRSERVQNFIMALRNTHVDQLNKANEEENSHEADIHATVCEALSAVEVLLCETFKLDVKEYY